MYHERTKYIVVRLHFIWNVVADGAILVKKIAIADNPVDMMTNPTPAVKFKHCLDLIDFGSTWVPLGGLYEDG